MSVTASMVKELRERTSAAMMDCKKALVECTGNMEEAIDWLRQKGLSKAAKKADRVTTEGVIVSYISPDCKTISLCALQCETDFVARNDAFKQIANTIAKGVAEGKSVDSFEGDIQNAIATLGENIAVAKTVVYSLDNREGVLGLYVHSNGKVAAVVELTTDLAPNEAIRALGNNLAMQVVATKPEAISPEAISEEIIERERELYRNKAKEEGKPENIIDKIVEGAVSKFFKEACLLQQAYIKDDKLSITQLVHSIGKEHSRKIDIKRFLYFPLN
ncbi:MAG: translation elongation factor Ts [Desulfovibrionaceae bacterium]